MWTDDYKKFLETCLVNSAADKKAKYQFLVQDLIELRRNAWVARREVEGPKKIDQVHADARRDDANRARAAAGGPNMRGNRGGGDYRGGGGGLDSYGGPPQRYAKLEDSSPTLSCHPYPPPSPLHWNLDPKSPLFPLKSSSTCSATHRSLLHQSPAPGSFRSSKYILVSFAG